MTNPKKKNAVFLVLIYKQMGLFLGGFFFFFFLGKLQTYSKTERDYYNTVPLTSFSDHQPLANLVPSDLHLQSTPPLPEASP